MIKTKGLENAIKDAESMALRLNRTAYVFPTKKRGIFLIDVLIDGEKYTAFDALHVARKEN